MDKSKRRCVTRSQIDQPPILCSLLCSEGAIKEILGSTREREHHPLTDQHETVNPPVKINGFLKVIQSKLRYEGATREKRWTITKQIIIAETSMVHVMQGFV